MKLGVSGRSLVEPYRVKKLKGDEQKHSKYFVRLIAADERGVLAQITRLLADYRISLEQVVQQPLHAAKEAEIVLVTHRVSKRDLDQVLDCFNRLDVIHQVKSCYRVEDGEPKEKPSSCESRVQPVATVAM
jgi:homoserine dehydrogenase